MIAGDGIGPEIAQSVERIFKAAKVCRVIRHLVINDLYCRSLSNGNV